MVANGVSLGSAKRNIYSIFHFENGTSTLIDLSFRDHQGNLSLDSVSPEVGSTAAQGLVDARGTVQGFDDAWDDCSSAAQTWWSNRDATAKSDIRTSLTRLADCFD